MPFNPKTYAVRSDQVVENYEARKKWREENKHLALPFFVKELRGQVPDIFPEEMALIGAASGDGKTEIMKAWHAQAQEAIEQRGDPAVTIFGSQEESTERLAAQDIEKRGPVAASSRPTVWVGTSFGMSADDMEDLHMTNFITTVDYVHRQSFAQTMPIADVFYDYLQATPNDPTRRDQISEGLYRLQVNDNTRRLFKAAKQYRCPVVTASQTGIKKLNTPYNAQMPIPGRGDFAEASGVYQIPDFVFGFWLARNTHSVGKRIEIDNWNFTVEKNLAFIWFLKARGHSPETAKGISKVFPVRIINDEYTYDADYHRSMLVSSKES